MPVDSMSSRIAAVVLMCAGASMFQVQPLFLGAVAANLHITEAQVGLLAGVELTGAALASVLAMAWVPRLSWRRVAYAGAVVLAAGNLMSATVASFEALLALRFTTGLLGGGTLYAVSLAVASDVRNPDRLFGLAVAALVALTMIAMLLLPRSIAAFGTAGILLPLAAFAICVLPLVRFVPHAVSCKPGLQAADAAGARLPILLGLAAQTVWYAGVGAVWAYLERIGAQSGLDLSAIGLAIAIGMGLGVLGALTASAIGTRWGRMLMYGAGTVGQVVAMLMLLPETGFPVFLVAVSLFNLGWNFCLPFLLGAIAQYDPSSRYTVLIIAAQGAGLAAGPLAASVIVAGLGLGAVLAGGIAACLASLVLFAAMIAAAARASLSQTGQEPA